MIAQIAADQGRTSMSGANTGTLRASDGKFEAEFDDLGDQNPSSLAHEGQERSAGFEEDDGREAQIPSSETGIENIETEEFTELNTIEASDRLNFGQPTESVPHSKPSAGLIEVPDLGAGDDAKSTSSPATSMERFLTSQLSVAKISQRETGETLPAQTAIPASIDASVLLPSPISEDARIVNSNSSPVVGLFAEQEQMFEASVSLDGQSHRILQRNEQNTGGARSIGTIPTVMINVSGAGLTTGQDAVEGFGLDQIFSKLQSPTDLAHAERSAEATTSLASLGANTPQNAAALPLLPKMLGTASAGRISDGAATLERSVIDGDSLAVVDQRVAPLDRQATPQSPLPQNPATVAQQAREVAVQIAASAKAGRMDVMLVPEDLGRLRLTLTPAEVGHAVLIDIERPEVLEAVRRHLDVLTSAFEDAGFSNLSFSFSQQNQTEGEQEGTAAADPVGQDSAEYLPPQIVKMAASGRLDLKL